MCNLFEGFNNLKTDVEKWKWVIDNQHLGFTVMLDNDDTFLSHPENNEIGEFDGYLGWSDGAISLLEALGVESESV